MGPRGSSAKTAHRLAKAALFTLGQAWPEGLPFADLLTASSRLAEEEESPESLAEILMATYTAGMIELRAHAVRCTARVCDRPKAGALARSQAARGKLITTALHGTIECGDEVERRLIALMDGTRDFPALVRDLTPVSGRSEEAVAEAIRANVAALARAGVLVE